MEITAAEFKARCLKLMDEVQATQTPITVTKRGRPVARLVPVEPVEAIPLFGCLSGCVTAKDDLIAPLDLDWDASADPSGAYT
ncbi:MAG: type II toxin-antitoxin system prevent-host-death family antitoxin [Gammaproteobacteria bacterium]|nr:type II toxin-antitoxin system prevent-host-death family antitoxin [Gammaproteobacteria bacterium]